MDQTSSQNLRRRMRWKCRSDGKGGTMKPSHPSHRPWKSPKNGDYHIPTARQLRRYTDISIGLATLSFLMSSNIRIRPMHGANSTRSTWCALRSLRPKLWPGSALSMLLPGRPRPTVPLVAGWFRRRASPAGSAAGRSRPEAPGSRSLASLSGSSGPGRPAALWPARG